METKDALKVGTAAPAEAGVREQMGLIQWAAKRFGDVEAAKVMGILRATCFRTGKGEEAATDAEVAALLIVARTYDLNPFTKEIFAFKDKHKGIVPIVSIDGWVSLVTRHKDFNGVEFVVGKEIKADHGGKLAFDQVMCRMYRKGIDKPVEVTEYFDEVYVAPRGDNAYHGPWQSHPKRMHRHKAYIQCARLTFGFGGIFDEDEAMRIIGSGEPELHVGGEASNSTEVSTDVTKRVEGTLEQAPSRATSPLAASLRAKAGKAAEAEVVEPEKSSTPPPQPAQVPASEAPAAGDSAAPKVAEGPTVESVREAIKACTSMDGTAAILQDVMKLPPSEDRAALMQEWNARVMEISGSGKKNDVPEGFQGKPADKVPAKPGRKGAKPAGTPEQLDELINGMEKADSMEKLNLSSDVARGYLWSPGQQNMLNDKYAERTAALK